VDVDASQPEHALHSRLRGDRLVVRVHRVEDRTVRLRVEVVQVEQVLAHRLGLDDAHLALRIRVEVDARLVEELP
jgi:hypothetical protein